MDRKTFIKELEFLLQDISQEERLEAINYYQNYFDEAGKENEQKILQELGEPSRVAAMIKDGLKGTFEEHIEIGNQGFSNEDYKYNYEVIDSKNSKKEQSKTLKDKWCDMESRDKFLLCVILILAIIPLSFPILGVFGGLFGAGFGIALTLLCLFFGFWIITFILYFIAIAFIVVGVLHLFSLTGAGLIYIGIGCIVMAIALIFNKIASWFFKECIPSLIDGLSSIFQKLFGNRGTES